VIAATIVLACSSDDDVETNASSGGGGVNGEECAPGETVIGGVCVAAGLPPDMVCPPGALLKDGGCVAAGVPPDGCGEGFVHDGDAGCVPVLPSEPCPPGLMAVPGDRACREVAPCGSAPWGNIPVEGSTQYVDQSYAGGGSDGSAAKPWTTISEGVTAAVPDAIVAIAAGSYAEVVLVDSKRVRLWGRCPALVETSVVQIAGADGSVVRGVAISGDQVSLIVGNGSVSAEELWIHDTATMGVGVFNDFGAAALELRGSLIEHTQEVAVYAAGTTLAVDASVVRDTDVNARGIYGRGINGASLGGMPSTFTVTGSLLERNHDVGVFVSGSTAVIEASVIRDTLPDGNGFGRAVGTKPDTDTGMPSSLTLRTSVVQRNREEALTISGTDALVEATVVSDTELDALGETGRAISVELSDSTGTASTLVLRSSLIAKNREAGVVVFGADAHIEGVVVRDTLPNASGRYGRGISIESDAETALAGSGTIVGSIVERNTDIGVFVNGGHADVEATIVRDTRRDGHGEFGRGIGVQPFAAVGRPSALALRTSIIEQSSEIGLVVLGSSAVVESSIVRDTQLDMAGPLGRAVGIEPVMETGAPSTLEMRATRLERSSGFGLAVIGSTAEVDGCVIDDTKVDFHGQFGDGVAVVAILNPAAATVTNTRVEHSARAGVSTFGADVSLGHAALSCQAFDLDVEPPGRFLDLGGNVCGCPQPSGPCKATAANLSPPQPLGQ
jgi:hypothetical protein